MKPGIVGDPNPPYLYNTTTYRYGARHNNTHASEPAAQITYIEIMKPVSQTEEMLAALEERCRSIAPSAFIDDACWSLETLLVVRRRDEDKILALVAMLNENGWTCRFPSRLMP